MIISRSQILAEMDLKKYRLARVRADRFLVDFFRKLGDELVSSHGRFNIKSFGRFKISYNQARKARNPKTGQVVMTGPTTRLLFQTSEGIKRRLNA